MKFYCDVCNKDVEVDDSDSVSSEEYVCPECECIQCVPSDWSLKH